MLLDLINSVAQLALGLLIAVVIAWLLWQLVKGGAEAIGAAVGASGAPERTPGRWANRPDRAAPSPSSGRLSRLGARLYNGLSRASGAVEGRYREGRSRGEQDRRTHGQPDFRSPWRRTRDALRTCPACGHGGDKPASPDCRCNYVSPSGRRCRCGGAPDQTTTDPAGAAPSGLPGTSTGTTSTNGGDPDMSTPAPTPGAPNGATHPNGAPSLGGGRPGAPGAAPGRPGSGGVAAAEFTVPDLFALLEGAVRQLTYAEEQMGSLQMGGPTCATIAAARDAAGVALSTAKAAHGRMVEAARDTAHVGRSEGYVAR